MTPAAAFLGAVSLAISGAAAQDRGGKTAPPPPPFAGVYQPRGADEIGLWREDDEHERELANSPLVIRDAALNAYVRGVFCATVGADRCAAVRTYILRVPAFNASMSPNGTMRINTGLLLRATNEAELAAVLGHEFGHFERRHSLQDLKARRTGTDLIAWTSVLAWLSNSRRGYRRADDVKISILGGLARFNRDQEREADRLGVGYLNAGPMPPQAASTVWRTFIREQEASAAARGLRRPDFERNSFFGSHPVEGERATYLYALAAADGAGRDDGAERYAAALGSWRALFLDDQIALNDFGASDFLITRLGEGGWTADLWRARGDLFRARGHLRDLMNAADFYGKAVALDPSLAGAYRGLGLALAKTGRVAEGRVALRRYLDLSPGAEDAPMIAATIASLADR